MWLGEKKAERWGLCLLGAVLLAGWPAARVEAFDWSGFVALEGRAFFAGEGDGGEPGETLSAAFEGELYHAWDEGDQSFRFTPFVRWDSADSERSHADVRELYWLKAARGWELALGVRKLFWGVTESVHLVDVINQTDLVEDPDGEAKLGQPMAQLKLLRRWGNLDLFLLPGFRERTFPGRDGRLGPRPRVDEERARYESSAGRDHLDWAVRWSHVLGPIDLGVSHFEGTGREPRLVPELATGGEVVLAPLYEQVSQTGLDLQATLGAWLWKLEAISRRDRLERFTSAVGGFEYTYFDVGGSGLDVGALAELFYDQREVQPEALFLGSRLTLNDVQSTQLLVGASVSLDDDTVFVNVEGSRRLGSSWRLSLRGRAFVAVGEGHPLFSLRDDDYLQLELARFF